MSRGSVALADGIFGDNVDNSEEADKGAIGIWLMSSVVSVVLAVMAIHPGGVRSSSVLEITLPPLTDVSGLDVDFGAHFDACKPM